MKLSIIIITWREHLYTPMKKSASRSCGSYNNRIMSTKCILIDLQLYTYVSKRSKDFFFIEHNTYWPSNSILNRFQFESSVYTMTKSEKNKLLKTHVKIVVQSFCIHNAVLLQLKGNWCRIMHMVTKFCIFFLCLQIRCLWGCYMYTNYILVNCREYDIKREQVYIPALPHSLKMLHKMNRKEHIKYTNEFDGHKSRKLFKYKFQPNATIRSFPAGSEKHRPPMY